MINDGIHRTRPRIRTEFSPLEDQYFVNDKGLLEVSPIQRNTQAIIDSAEYTKLDELYDRMLEIGRTRVLYDEGIEAVRERERHESALDDLLYLDRVREQYISDNPNVAGYTHKQLYDYVNSRVAEANQKIKDYKEGKINASQNEIKGESQQKELYQNGTESA